MKELIKFELIKTKENYLYLVMLIIMMIILMVALIVDYLSPRNYVIKQQQLALQVVYEQQLSQEAKNLYLDIVNSDNYVEIYQAYNQIDLLNQGYPSDLDYDYQTNIDYRNYHLKYQLDPDDHSGALFIYDVYNHLIKYLIVPFIIIISLNMIIYEKQLKTDHYLLTLNYHLYTICFVKCLVSMIISCLIIILPLLSFYLLSSLIYGFSDSHVIVASNLLFANVLINDFGFITINRALLINGIIIVLLVVLINTFNYFIIYLLIKRSHKAK